MIELYAKLFLHNNLEIRIFVYVEWELNKLILLVSVNSEKCACLSIAL